MKKNKILISLSCFATIIILSLVTFLIVASNYKKTYVLNAEDYRIGINPQKYYGYDMKIYNYYQEKKQAYRNGENFEVIQQIDLFIFDETHTTRKKVITCTKSKYIRGNSNTEHNAFIYTYGYMEHEIPRKGYYKFVEYPLWKSKNCLYVTYCFGD